MKEQICQITEGMVVDLNQSECKRVDFEKNQPLVYVDVNKIVQLMGEKAMDGVMLDHCLGIPISLTNGEKFGTLCAVNDEASP